MLSNSCLLLSLVAYLLGSICVAIPVCKLFSLPNPSESGSKNPGATNVYRLGGWLPASITLTGDALKGTLPVLLSINLDHSAIEQGLVAMFAICGHMLPIFFKFQGGKGVATTLGAGIALAWTTTLALTLIWISFFALFRVSSIASLAAAFTAPFISHLMSPDYTFIFLIISMLIVIRHRANVIKILHRQETRTKHNKNRQP
ncbi:MAG: glycerol-3-phosphate 1-O-acyltransferase PlsY [Hahellaceae bacterium]|jgi:glycerol-3-phosphate acyltransferase PlsY|nr:glycerol-3-phosphate 1-O-acyltransferase PlsY [Hahellaceae bacterium]